MDKGSTTKGFSKYRTSSNEKITFSLTSRARDKRKLSGFPIGEAEPQEPSAKRIKSTGPNQVPAPALDQRPTVVREVSSHFESGQASVIPTHQETPHQSLSTGEFYFANDLLNQQRIIDQLRHEQPATYCIRSLDDLEKQGLIKQTWVEEGQLLEAEGRLFLNEPMTLVFDLTTMTPGDIASFNDLLQVGPTCNGKPLGDRIRRVFLVNEGMLQGSQPSNPDLWRRLGQMRQQVVPETDSIADSVTDEALLAQKTREKIPANVPLITIDFATTDNWHRRLFGGITLNERGRLVFSAGALANLEENTHLMFKNAPWDDTSFQTALATAIRVGGFTANRQWVRLPEQISLSRKHVCATELKAWKHQTIKDSTLFSPQSPFVVINSSSLERLKGHVKIEGTAVVQTDMLASLLLDCRQLMLTGELDEQQWLWLLSRLDELPEGKRPLLFTDLPTDLLLGTSRWQTREACDQHSATDKPGPSITYEINPKDTLESLQQVNLTSQNNFTFSRTNSPLMEALVNGTPIILSGLERNPELAANLETLLLPAPYLFIHGHKIDLPKAKVTFTQPSGEPNTGSALINAIFRSADSQQQTPKNPVYSLLKSLPRSCQRNYPDRPPWTGEDFQYRFDRQAEAERLLDGSPELLPCHQRRALHVLLAKAYRGDPKVYSFIKAKIAHYYPDQPADNRADRSALERWLAQHPNPQLKDIKAHFWTLARHCPTTVHQHIGGLDDIDDDSLKQLASYVVGASPPAQRRFLTQRLRVDRRLVGEKLFYNGNVRSTLRDILIAHRPSLKRKTIIRQRVGRLESQISSVLMADQTDQHKSQQIREILATAFVKRLLPEQCQDLPNALAAQQRDTRARQERRLLHLVQAVQEHPIIFLQGEAGVGKSFVAQAAAAKAGYPTCQVIQLGPNQTSEALFGGQQLISHPTGIETRDHYTEFREGPLLLWALSKDPALLVLKDANQAPEGLLAILAGLNQQPPVLHYQGRKYPLTEKHRIILTGHPDHYPGRHLDNTLKSRIPTFFYNPLPDTVLAQAIILPNLPQAWPDQRKQQACERILTLFNHFRELLPGELTPRDITDVLATIRQILSHSSVTAEVTPEQVNALVRQAFMDSLAGAVTDEYQQRLTTLNLWYQSQYPEDSSIMAGVDRSFDDFSQQLQVTYPDGDFSPAPIQQLVYRYWQSLDKDESGRGAILVEGPAGWGKDFVLDRTIQLWQKKQQEMKQRPVRPFVHINANPNQWTTLVENVEQAMSRGQLIAISELNLIPSGYVEGLLNNVLAGHGAPGFRLFATINPGYFAGREALSKALTSRCTQVRLGALAPEELASLVQKLPNIPGGLPQWLAGHFHQLSTALYQQNCPVQLALDDLFSSARHLANQSPNQWSHALQQHLSLPFRALTTELPPLQEDAAGWKGISKEEQRHLALGITANSLPGLSRPIRVKMGSGGKSKVTVRSFGLKKNGHLASPFVFGDVVTPLHFEVTRYYPKHPYDARQYRLSFMETHLDEDGQLLNYSINWTNSTTTPVAGWPDDMAWRIELRKDELPGKITLTLNNQWQPLPALTRSDQLRAIRCTPETDIDLARSTQTGQLLIRTPECTKSPVTIDFIIAPDQTYFTQLQTGEPLELQEGLCSQRLLELLDEHIFYPITNNTCEAYAELYEINQIEDIPDRLRALMNWLDTFSSTKNVAGQGAKLLLAMFSEKQGACEQKAKLFQLLCHYWGIPALQVRNASHRFVEISPDGGLTWRQYQLGGGGQCSSDVTEPGWEDYRRTEDSVLKLPIDRKPTCSGQLNLKMKIEDDLKKLVQQFSKNQSAPTQVMQQLKNNYRVLNRRLEVFGISAYYDLPYSWWILLSPQALYQFGENIKDWESIIEKSAWNMENNRRNALETFNEAQLEKLFCLIQKKEIDVHYLNWLYDLYHSAPQFLKYALLAILQTLSRRCDSSQLKNRVKLMLMSYPLSPEELDIGERREHGRDKKLSKRCINLIKTMPMSRPLLDRLSQHRIDQQLHHQPVGNSIIVPEKLMSGEAAFLNVSKTTSYKPIIFDCTSLQEQEIDDRIDIKIKSGIKPEIMEVSDNKKLGETIKKIFFYWLAAHHIDDTNSPLWLMHDYADYCETAQPFKHRYLLFSKWFVHPVAFLELPPERIKEYFNQPSAVVLQQDDLLLLLDEFLSLIAT